MLSEKLQKIRNGYIPRSNKILIQLHEPERIKTIGGILLNEAPIKDMQIKDLHKNFKYHPFLATVIRVGAKVAMEEPEIMEGKIILLRNNPAANEYLLIDNEIYWAIAVENILCTQAIM